MTPDLFGYLESPGFKEHTTSRDAAEKMRPHVQPLQAAVLKALDELALTPDEIAHLLGRSVLAVRPRVTELALMGLIEQTGERRRNESGMRAHVYQLCKGA